MLHDFTVRVIVKDKNLDTVNEKVCTFPFYCQEQRHYLTRALGDIEKAFQDLQAGKPKEEWNDVAKTWFKQIRHNILNAANGIERLPRTLHYKDTPVDRIPSGEYIAEWLNAKYNSAAAAEGDSHVDTVQS